MTMFGLFIYLIILIPRDEMIHTTDCCKYFRFQLPGVLLNGQRNFCRNTEFKRFCVERYSSFPTRLLYDILQALGIIVDFFCLFSRSPSCVTIFSDELMNKDY